MWWRRTQRDTRITSVRSSCRRTIRKDKLRKRGKIEMTLSERGCWRKRKKNSLWGLSRRNEKKRSWRNERRRWKDKKRKNEISRMKNKFRISLELDLMRLRIRLQNQEKLCLNQSQLLSLLERLQLSNKVWRNTQKLNRRKKSKKFQSNLLSDTNLAIPIPWNTTMKFLKNF